MPRVRVLTALVLGAVLAGGGELLLDLLLQELLLLAQHLLRVAEPLDGLLRRGALPAALPARARPEQLAQQPRHGRAAPGAPGHEGETERPRREAREGGREGEGGPKPLERRRAGDGKAAPGRRRPLGPGLPRKGPSPTGGDHSLTLRPPGTSPAAAP